MRNGVIDLPWSSQGTLNDGTISSSGLISGISITVRSMSLGNLTINYAATADGTNFQGSGQSINGIISTITATRIVPSYRASNDFATVVEDSGVVATGNLLDNDNDQLALVTSVEGKAIATSGTTKITGTYGTLTIDADGAYSYALDNANPAVNALKYGYMLDESFSYKGGNANGTGSAILFISIDGRNDPKIRVNGTSGNDTLSGTTNAEIFSGGKGSDTVSYARAKAGVTADLAVPSNNVGAAADDAYVSIENLKGSAFNDTLRGDANANTLDGSGGADRLEGGAGNDTYIVDDVYDFCYESSGTGGTDLVVASVSYRLGWYSNVENLTLTGKASLNGTGNELANTLTGNRGHNILDGGEGADKLHGGFGHDLYIIDNAGDRVFEKVGEGKDTLRTSVSYVLAAGQEVESLELAAGSGNLDLKGNGFANTLRDNFGNNRLDGGGGNDLLISSRGSDTLVGGTGSDSAVIDRAAATVALSFVMESVNGVTTLVGDGTTTTSIGNITLTGGSEDDTFTTLSGTDVLKGGAGNDTLGGGTGNDRLIGGHGADTFVFSTALGADNVDRIADFAAGDAIRLSTSVFSALSPRELAADAFKNLDTAPVDADDRILYDPKTGGLFYDADGSGKTAAVKFAVLDNKAAITHADFLIA